MQAGEEGDCQAFVLASPHSNYCQDLAWKGVIEAAYGQEPHYLVCRDRSGAISGLAPAFWMESVFFGRQLVSLPYLDYGGILAADAESETALLATLRTSARGRRARLDLRQDRPVEGLPAPSNAKVKMMLDLGGRSRDVYWDGLDAKVRNQVRKAEKSGILVQRGGEEMLDDFYRVFCVNMRDLGSPVHDKGFFRDLLRRIPGAEIALAMWGDYCVGGLVRIHWKHTMAIPWASTLRKYRSRCPNNALYWHTLADAFGQGCSLVDFGRSTRDAGTYRFKQQWQAREEPLPWYGFAPSGASARSAAHPSGLMQLVSNLWSRLPVRYANRLGPQIRGAFSN